MKEGLVGILKSLPCCPGVYLMKNSAGHIVYIGKAKILKNRVKSYFTGYIKDEKVLALTSCVENLEYIIAPSEKDALSLEANLIKQHKPKYNILLKDDKKHPYIKIAVQKEFPTIEIVRLIKKDGAKYFGPYFGSVRALDILEIIQSSFRLRACKNKLKQARPCINYDIKLCHGSCCDKIEKDQYKKEVEKAIAFLNGKDTEVSKLLLEKMNKAKAEEEFERAITYRDRLLMLKALKEKNIADLAKEDFNLDAVFVTQNETAVSCAVVVVRGGKIVGVEKQITRNAISFNPTVQFLMQYYVDSRIRPKQIVLLEGCLEKGDLENIKQLLGVKVTVAKIGQKKKLVEMAKVNAQDALEKQKPNTLPLALENLRQVLALENPLKRIECFDISHLSGTDTVASRVVFINGLPEKKLYRKYKIKANANSDDYLAMKEVIFRRLSKLDGDLIDLIIIDGGKGQLSAAISELEKLNLCVPIISLAEKNEEVFIKNNPLPIVLDKHSPELKLLQRIRDEAHRFALGYHHKLREKRLTRKVP